MGLYEVPLSMALWASVWGICYNIQYLIIIIIYNICIAPYNTIL